MTTITLGQAKADVVDQADIAGATVRYTPTMITRLINQARDRFYEKLALEGESHFTSVATGTIQTGPTSPHSFTVVDFSAVTSLVRVISVDVVVNGQNLRLAHVPFADRDKYGGPNSRGVPVAWATYQTKQIAVFPTADQSYPYVLYYLPALTPLVNDADTWEINPGWDQYVTWDVVTRLIVKDQYANAYQMAVQTRNEIWDDLMNAARRVTSEGGSRTGRDTFAENYVGGSRRGWLPPP